MEYSTFAPRRGLLRACRLVAILALAWGNPLAAMSADTPINLPSGLDGARLGYIDNGQQMRVYVSLLGYDDAKGGAAVYPGEVGKALGSVAQMNKRFMDMVSETRRFEVFDDTDTGIREESDIVITGQITRASQVMERFLRGRKAVTTISLSVQIKNSLTGKILDQSQAVESFGQRPGEGTLVLNTADISSPDIQQKLAEDYQEAFTRALEHAAAYFESTMRPYAKVVGVSGGDLQLIGGSKQGLQSGDELVIFQAEGGAGQSGDDRLRHARALALVRCDSVGTDTSACQLIQRARGTEPPAPGSYGVLSDQSLKLRFE